MPADVGSGVVPGGPGGGFHMNSSYLSYGPPRGGGTLVAPVTLPGMAPGGSGYSGMGRPS